MKKLLIASVFALSIPFGHLLLNLSSRAMIGCPSPFPTAGGRRKRYTGVDATSEDGAIYFSIDVADAASSDKTTEIAIDFLTKNGVKIDPATLKESPETDVNGSRFPRSITRH